jgi:hypothetical protein
MSYVSSTHIYTNRGNDMLTIRLTDFCTWSVGHFIPQTDPHPKSSPSEWDTEYWDWEEIASFTLLEEAACFLNYLNGGLGQPPILDCLRLRQPRRQ